MSWDSDMGLDLVDAGRPAGPLDPCTPRLRVVLAELQPLASALWGYDLGLDPRGAALATAVRELLERERA